MGFLAHRLAAPIAAGLAMLFLVGLVYQTFRIEGFLWWDGFKDEVRELTADKAVLERDLAQCRANTATLEGSIETQNRLIAEWERRGAEALAMAQEAARLAAANNARANRTAGQLLALQPVGEVCNAALDLIRGPVQ